MSEHKIIGFIILGLVLVYEKIIRRQMCETKIHRHVLKLGGSITSIDKMTPRDEIYNVRYKKDGKYVSCSVKFSLLYKEEWY